jgi:transcriptional regulator GlxA family with amidase domain
MEPATFKRAECRANPERPLNKGSRQSSAKQFTYVADVDRIGILVFDDVEELDFVGPLEVFGMAVRLRQSGEVRIIAHGSREVRCRHGLQIVAHDLLPDCGNFDLLIVPGGLGARIHASKSKPILDLVRQQTGVVASVCTGALVLAAAGILAGKEATTHHSAFELLRAYPEVIVVEGQRATMNGRIWTAAGISAGVDMSLRLVAHLWGDELAAEIAEAMEWSA